jgi:hypothetical protein
MTMAKKKRAAPSKTCIDPKCGATMHARVAACPKCGKAQPKKEKPEPKAKPAAAKRGRPAGRKPTKAAPGGLPEAISFIRQVGGLGQAKELLNQIDEIKKL